MQEFVAPSPQPIPEPRRSPAEVALLFLGIIVALTLWWLVQNPRRARQDTGSLNILQVEKVAEYAVAPVSLPGQRAGARDANGQLGRQLLSQAERGYWVALRKSPRSARLRRGLAALLFLQGDRAGARSVLREPVRLSAEARPIWSAVQAAFGVGDEPLSLADRVKHRRALQDPALGWSRLVALEALSATPQEARAWRDQLTREYGGRTRRAITLAVVFLFVLFPLGVVALVMYGSRPRPNRLPPLPLPARLLVGLFVLGLMVYQMPGALMAVFLSRASASPLQNLPLAALAGVIGAVVVYLLSAQVLRTAGLRLGALGWSPRHALPWSVGGYLALLPLMSVSFVAVVLLQRAFPNVQTPPNPAAGLALGAQGWRLVYVVLLACVLAPLVEELLVRGLLFRGLANRYGTTVGALASSFIFAGLHPQLPAGFPPLFVIALALCFLYRATGSLVPCILVHALNNGVALLMVTTALGTAR